MVSDCVTSENDLRQHAAILAYVRASRRLSQLAREIEPELRQAAHDLPNGRRGSWFDVVLVKNAIEHFAMHCDSLVDHSPLAVPDESDESPFPDSPSNCIAPAAVRFKIGEVMRYLASSEERHYREAGQPEDHVWHRIQAIQQWLSECQS